METLEYRTLDKSEWGPGAWADEPDKRQWQDPATKLPCLIVRARHTGALCGYVGVPAGHPMYGETDTYLEERLEAHGGITFADRCQPGGEGEAICHIPGPGESDDVWWLGFDCAHAGDMCPRIDALHRSIKSETRMELLPMPAEARAWVREAYRDLAYVISEVEGLARQLAAVE